MVINLEVGLVGFGAFPQLFSKIWSKGGWQSFRLSPYQSMNKTTGATKIDSLPDSLIDLLSERAAWEESTLDQIKAAHDRNDATEVMKLVGTLLNGGPGTK
jgi:hypothetical protein